MKKVLLFTTMLLFVSFSVVAQSISSEGTTLVEIKTNKGTFVVKLFNETPIHRDNFIRLVEQNAYDNVLFHRVIKNFMVQAGGNTLNGTEETEEELEQKYSETLPAEILYPKLYHKRGMLAAARTPNEVNPERRSSSFHFYIVVGKHYLEYELQKSEQKNNTKIPDEIKKTYMIEGGTPHLDNEYTVFGEVVKGFKVIEKIQEVETNTEDKPLKPVYIKSAKIIKQ